MRIVYFIMIHHKPHQAKWLLDAIYTDEELYCIHVDKRASDDYFEEIKAYVGGRPNVLFLAPRRKVVWAGWSQVAVELQAIQTALSAWQDWDYFINLSGQDYPIKTIASIKQSLQAAWPRNFIRAWPLAKVQQIEPNDPHLSRRLAFEFFGRVIQTKIPLPFPRSIDINYKGSNWHILARDFCAWAVSDPLVKRVERIVRYTISPDEVFFQALIMNSPFKDCRMEDAYRFVIWPGPKTLRDEDYDKIRGSDCLFARKFDHAVDHEILNRLAGELGFNVPDTGVRSGPAGQDRDERAPDLAGNAV